MAAKLSTTLGRPQTFHYGQKPWHGVGTELTRAATAAAAMKQAGLDWEVRTEPLYLKGEVHVAGHQAIVRQLNGTKHVFGIMGSRYVLIQNRDSFAFFDALVQAGKASYHAAGTVGAGEQVWLLVKLPGELRVAGKDRVEKYLLLVNSHAGDQAVRAYFTPVRVACENTLMTALDGVKTNQGMSVRHRRAFLSKQTEDQRFLQAEARHLVEQAERYYAQLLPVCNAMTKRQVTQAEATDYFKRLIPATSGRESSTRSENIRRSLNILFHTGAGNSEPGIRGSLWALYNAVTEFVTHRRTTRPPVETERGPDIDEAAARLASSWFGSGARLSVQAFEDAQVLLKKH